MQLTQLSERELIRQQPERVWCALMQGTQTVHRDPHDLLMLGTELTHRMHGRQFSPPRILRIRFGLRGTCVTESHISRRQHVEVGHRDHPATIITIRLVEDMELDGGAIDEPRLFAQTPCDSLGESFLGTQNRARQLPNSIAGMCEEHVQATSGNGAEDRGVDRDRGPWELRQ
ncbi:hypothetical protein GCM10009691_39610 [Brevibacterium picturae]|uniref:Uncharacterized protein n=1 Tax=Brevibacterium picturae TaxID=260553 RepID=A0ABN2CS92_9MICO